MRRAAGFFLRRATADGWRYLLLENARRREWGFPKGHAEPGETAYACALRECAEEAGIACLAPTGPGVDLDYVLPGGRPKRVTFFPARTAQARVALSPEHRRAGWFAAGEVCERLEHRNLIESFRAHGVAGAGEEDAPRC